MTTAPLSLEHIVRPSNITDKKPPVLFMLHGYGSNEDDLFSFAAELPAAFCIISLRAPYALQSMGYAWYAINFDADYGKWSDDEQAIDSREKIVKFMDESCDAYYLDKENINLLGFSQGTILSYAVALSYPEKVKNVVALSGYINEKILVDGFEKKDFSSLQIYISHGQVDQVIPVEWAQRAPTFLKKLGISHSYQEFPAGHGVAPQNFYSLQRWLQEKI
ncbi:alpha/beta hydrolase [Maribacter aestuarii]|uniref:alpha/beta hydrolase n=1 Tax=Maribacter aestuarii TaxID=1130723 RepID=UPI00248BBFD3|nr:alpha/beta fold hydrolase [Maribacter aestuarii]